MCLGKKTAFFSKHLKPIVSHKLTASVSASEMSLCMFVMNKETTLPRTNEPVYFSVHIPR